MNEVTIPTELFTLCEANREPQHWTDERGFVFEIDWSEEHQKPLAGVVGVPEDSHLSEAWEPFGP